MQQDLKPLKISKACVTRWLNHGESCIRVIVRFEPLLDALDSIFMERGDAEAKGVRDQLLQLEIICMLLLLAEVLSPINIFSKYLQTSTLLYCDVGAKLDRLLQRLHLIKDSLKDHDSVDTPLKFFSKVKSFLEISSQRNDLGRNTRGRTLATELEPDEHVQNFLPIAYSFLDDLIDQLTEELTDTNTIASIQHFSNVNKSSSHRNEQIEILLNHYGKDITDVLNNHSSSAQSLVSIQQQHLEQENFFEEFDDTAADLLANVKSFARRKLNCGEMNQEHMQLYITSNTPSSNDIYMQLVKAGALVRFPNTMKLYSLSLLIPPSTSGVERAFSVMNVHYGQHSMKTMLIV